MILIPPTQERSQVVVFYFWKWYLGRQTDVEPLIRHFNAGLLP